MKQFVIALLLASCNGIRLSGGPNTPAPGAKATDPRQVLHVHPGLKGFDISTLEHCPDFNERMTLLNGKTKGIAYPAAGFNCNADYGLAQTSGGPNTAAPGAGKGETRQVMYGYPGLKGFNISSLEHCPDFNERMTLLNGKTRAVAYPAAGFNCNADYGLAQSTGGPNTQAPGLKAVDPRQVLHVYPGLKGFNISTLEHCPDFNERMTLLNGKTRAVAYPAAGFNCNADYGLAQSTGGPNTPAPGAAKGEARNVLHAHPGLKGFDISTLEHCPDFNERMTLLNGKTKGIAYPAAGFNCNADYGLAQGGPGTAAPGTKTPPETRYIPYAHTGLKGFDIHTLEHCPDFNERMTLLNGRTKAVAYPAAGFNCNADYGL